MNDTFMKTKPVFPLLVSMALPNVISMLVNSLYNIVDSLFVAQISEQAMTALSLVFPIQNFVNAVSIGFGIGINAQIALYLGAGDHENANRAATHGMMFSLLHGVLGMVLCIAIMPGFLRRFTTDPALGDMGVTYSTIVFLFSLVNMADLAFEKIFQSVGRMNVAMVALITGCVTNIHQNSMPQHPTVHGAQVFSNPQEPAAGLAQSIQQALNLTVNTGNEKTAKAIGNSVYLMKHITCPGVLVECGFLSNSHEAQLLRQPEQQKRLVAAIVAGYLNFGNH